RGELPPADTNAASLIMRVDLGSSTVLLLGDSGEVEHAALLQSDANLSADVVKVAHHGSSDLDTGVFAASGARWYLVSAGAGNRYGHPVRSVLESIRMHGGVTFRSDELGSVALDIDPERGASLWHERGDVSGSL